MTELIQRKILPRLILLEEALDICFSLVWGSSAVQTRKSVKDPT